MTNNLLNLQIYMEYFDYLQFKKEPPYIREKKKDKSLTTKLNMVPIVS
jgi:hypothetical protein